LQTRSNSRSHIQIVATLTQRLKILRENNGYSQREVAEYLGKERSTYAYYELGKTVPSLDVLVALSKLYEVSCEFLLGIETDHKECKEIEKRVLHILRYTR
jgi:hypothetical protein